MSHKVHADVTIVDRSGSILFHFNTLCHLLLGTMWNPRKRKREGFFTLIQHASQLSSHTSHANSLRGHVKGKGFRKLFSKSGDKLSKFTTDSV